ncbi:hypothetical protein PCANC_18509 [Puccinia coronata f. sp. avenae]|uniref:CCHC-type domain-containing protein n=1 Tax=Puccinia coronata f. sp. avenae TaxID=200324 RepID=A0A2N5SPU8_9BASI|nr:hypothetical protein PCANC_18509 [Puccinia coronata f. sp. avenae]
MDAAMNNGEVHAADNAARDEVINNLQHQVKQLLASNANKQAQIQQLVANALNPPPQAQRPEAAPKIETIPIRLPDFNGCGDVDIWIKKVECVLSGRNYHKDRWTSMIVTNLKDFSEAFWFNLVSELRVDDMPWPIFKQKLMYQFNYAHKQYDAWLELQFLKYTTANDYINKFKHTSIKLPSSKMSDNNKKFLFTVNLPGHLCVKVLSDKCNTLDNLFQSLQEHDCLEKRSFYQGTSGSGTYNNNHQSFVPHNHHQRSLSSNFPFTPKALVSQAVPMDLDAMDVSKARCYNCNKIGHLSKDSPAPRKIQYANSKMPDKNCQKNNLVCGGCTPSQPGVQTPACRTPTNGVRTAGSACGPAGQACWPCTPFWRACRPCTPSGQACKAGTPVWPGSRKPLKSRGLREPLGALIRVPSGTLIRVLFGTLIRVLFGTLIRVPFGTLIRVPFGTLIRVPFGTLIRVRFGTLIRVPFGTLIRVPFGTLIRVLFGTLIRVPFGTLIRVLFGTLIRVPFGTLIRVPLVPYKGYRFGTLIRVPFGTLIRVPFGTLIRVPFGTLIRVPFGTLIRVPFGYRLVPL